MGRRSISYSASEADTNTDLNKRLEEPTLVRRKSSSRRKDDRRREDQVRAMTTSSPINVPKRSGGESPRFYQRARSYAGHAYPDPSSTVSLGGPPSVRSSMTAGSDSHRFDLRAVDIFSARPTLRYSLSGQYGSGALRSSAPSRADSKRETRPISRPTIEENRTIDEYADSMDARTLRELMDRDQRRKERRRKTDQDRARKRLERYAARGDTEPGDRKHRSRRKEKEIEKHKERTQEAAGLGLHTVDQPASSGHLKEYGPVGTESERPITPHSPAADPFSDSSFAISSEMSHVEPPEMIGKTHPEPIPTIPYEQVKEDFVSPTAFRHDRQASTLSQSTDPRTNSMHDLSQVGSYGDRRPSEARGARRTGTLSALFRRSGLHKRGPSRESFSNTSRESMAARFTPPPDNHERTYRRASSGAPIRTKSKFREDLPESPISPPESRVQSPIGAEDEGVPPLPSEQARFGGDGGETVTMLSQRGSYDSTMAPSAGLLSQSLASVDSEGSWLSGRPRKRTSQQMSLGRSSFIRSPSALGNQSTEDLGLYEDMPARRSYGPDHPSGLSNIRSVLDMDDDKTGRDSPQDEQINQGHVSRRPTIVNRQPRVHSSEGLLRQFTDDSERTTQSEVTEDFETASEATAGQSSPEQASPEEVGPVVKQATLTHTRSISAGSARLLEIPSRTDSQRNSRRISQLEPSVE